MDADDGLDDDEPAGRWLDPDDRLWRHPSEVANNPWPSSAPPDGPAAGAPTAPVSASRHDRRLWGVAVLAGVVGALLATGTIAAAGRLGRRPTVVRPFEQVIVPATVTANGSAMTSADGPVVWMAQRVRPSIVQVQVDGDKGHLVESGVILRTDGHVITTNHLIDGASKVRVVMADGRVVDAKAVAGDPYTDIGVIRISVSDKQPLTVAPLGSAADLKVGQAVVAIGSPLGVAGGPSVTTGVVSAVGREVEPRNGPPLLDMIQTDAPVARGSSGGALLDGNGSVIGITTSIPVVDDNAQALGLAVPIDIARDTVDQLIQTGHVVHAWMGVEGEDVDADTASHLAIAGGALVRDVRDGSPAASAGIKDRDIITLVDGRPVTTIGGLAVALRARKPGDKVDVTYVRDGNTRTCTVTLTTRPKSP